MHDAQGGGGGLFVCARDHLGLCWLYRVSGLIPTEWHSFVCSSL